MTSPVSEPLAREALKLVAEGHTESAALEKRLRQAHNRGAVGVELIAAAVALLRAGHEMQARFLCDLAYAALGSMTEVKSALTRAGAREAETELLAKNKRSASEAALGASLKAPTTGVGFRPKK